MIETIRLLPGVTLRCFTDRRFKHGILSLQFIRPTKREEAGMNALLPAVLLRGCQGYTDLRQITNRLDDLYGAGMGAIVRRIGDYQTTGISCSFIEDRFALPGDAVFAPMMEFLYRMIRLPHTENGVFPQEFVDGERKNLLAAIDAQKNDKRAYAVTRVLETMCANDPYGIPRLGYTKQIKTITPESLWNHYQKVLMESPVDIFYVGSQPPAQVATLLMPLFENLERRPIELPSQTDLNFTDVGYFTEEMEVNQGKLAMGFTTPVSLRHRLHFPMQILAMIYASNTGKLFNVIREELSLCYDIGGCYYGTKGFMTVSAGIDFDKEEQVRAEILHQLELCKSGDFTDQELENAKFAIISQMQSVPDSPAAIESFYSTAYLSGTPLTPEQTIQKIQQVTAREVAEAAATLSLSTTFFLKGVQ